MYNVREAINAWVILKPLNKRLFSHFCCTHVTHGDIIASIYAVYFKFIITLLSIYLYQFACAAIQ